MWKPIPEYENLYEASDDGKIRTAYNKTTSNRKFKTRVWKQRELRFSKRKRHENGFTDYMVTLWKDNKPRKFLVSRLIAATFCENNLNTELTVNHIDGNPHNNNANNLEWVTRAENVKLGFKNGQYSKSCKPIKILSANGIVLEFMSMAETDRFLERCNGYTSKHIIDGKNKLKSKTGQLYMIHKTF